MERIKELLKGKDIQPSFQRMKILEILLGRKDHPNAAMIHGEVLKVIPTISKTTVYNTLGALEEKGLITSLSITGEETRYDCHIQPHHHLLCRLCGAILDIDICCKYAQASELEGHKIEEVHGYFKGVCSNCLQNGAGRIK
jgi:Fe2+ or Zn2+ uptake regulation protein